VLAGFERRKWVFLELGFLWDEIEETRTSGFQMSLIPRMLFIWPFITSRAIVIVLFMVIAVAMLVVFGTPVLAMVFVLLVLFKTPYLSLVMIVLTTVGLVFWANLWFYVPLSIAWFIIVMAYITEDGRSLDPWLEHLSRKVDDG